ncbi:MAG: FAD-dependent oxidoreductase [Rhodospirillales bacterium]|nr:FAD-dependent oxidoreductase [Rhodospirillales bacterium]
MSVTHVVGAGIAGLAAAVRLTKAGRKVVLHEAANQAGGRCRSFHDAKLDRIVDNGTHLILGANPALFEFLKAVGGSLQECAPAAFPFFDRQDCKGWTIKPSKGALPWWVLNPSARLPGTNALDYLGGLRLMTAGPDATVAQAVRTGEMLDRLWGPLCEAILNSSPQEGQARLLGEVLKRTLLKGEAACRPYLAPLGLTAALIDPAVAWLRAQGCEIRFNHRLTAIDSGALVFDDGERARYYKDVPAILAVAPWVASDLLPALPRFETRPIVCAHFLLPKPEEKLPGGRAYLGIVRGLGQWWSLRGDVLSVTVSAATDLASLPGEDIAAKLWAECALMLGQAPDLPPYRVMKEQRATLAHTPATERLRPGPFDGPPGLILAGDWTATGLPCTLEGAALSGQRAVHRDFLSSPC